MSVEQEQLIDYTMAGFGSSQKLKFEAGKIQKGFEETHISSGVLGSDSISKQQDLQDNKILEAKLQQVEYEKQQLKRHIKELEDKLEKQNINIKEIESKNKEYWNQLNQKKKNEYQMRQYNIS